jgi:hypothetical protein
MRYTTSDGYLDAYRRSNYYDISRYREKLYDNVPRQKVLTADDKRKLSVKQFMEIHFKPKEG